MKRIFTFLFASMFAGQALGQDFLNENIWYTITDVDKHEVSVTRLSEAESVDDIEIPQEITNDGVTYTVTSIDNEAFWFCRTTSITIPNTVTRIGKSAFGMCDKLTSITIPNSVTSIGGKAFWGCNSLTSVILSNSITAISDSLFYGCETLESVNIPNLVTSIGNYAFCGCQKLKSVSIPNLVTSIGNYAFYECYGLTSVSIPNSVITIGNYAFQHCISLTGVTIPNSVTTIGDFAFSLCMKLTSITIPNSVTNLCEGAFCNCDNLASISIPNSITTIKEWVFGGCRSLTSVTIPNSVTSIEDYAFEDCVSLTSITIPSTVTNIAEYAFFGCDGLGFPSDFQSGGIYYLVTSYHEPYTVEVTYEMVYNENNYSGLEVANIPETVKFNGVTYTVTSIGQSAFFYCSSLKSVTIPSTVTKIAHSAFWMCDNLKSVTIPNSVTTIDDYAFLNCRKLELRTIPNSVTSIGQSAFLGCSSLKYLSIPNSVTSIGAQAFDAFNNLRAVIISDSALSIGENAFKDVEYIFYNGNAAGTPWGAINHNPERDEKGFVYSDATRKNLVLYIGDDTDITIPNTITNIDWDGLFGFTDLTSVVLPNWITQIVDDFKNRSSLKKIFIPNSVAVVYDSAFAGCDNLTIYCEASSKPNDWYEHWNPDNRPVVWGATMPTAINEPAASAINIYAHGNTIVVENATDEIRIYDAMGALICRDVPWRVSTGTTAITINNPGVYIVKTGGAVRRVMVN